MRKVISRGLLLMAITASIIGVSPTESKAATTSCGHSQANPSTDYGWQDLRGYWCWNGSNTSNVSAISNGAGATFTGYLLGFSFTAGGTNQFNFGSSAQLTGGLTKCQKVVNPIPFGTNCSSYTLNQYLTNHGSGTYSY
jgi:hypothetical protein